MIYSPVLLIVYTRKNNLERLVESLKTNPEAKETDVWIVSDAPSKEADREAVEVVRAYVKTISGFKSVNLVAPDKNSRVYKIRHTKPVVEMLCEKYGKYICLEDDNIVSKHFLRYMNEGLEFYKDYPNIGGICGYQLPIKIPKNYKESIYLGVRYSPWGIGFTKKWTEQCDVESVWDRYSEAVKPENKKKFLKAGKSLLDILKEDSEGTVRAPDARTCFYHIMNGIYCVFPCVSMVKNTGFDGSGEHNGRSSRWIAKLEDRDEYPIKWIENIQPDEQMIETIRKYHDHGYTFRHFVKEVLRKIGLFTAVKKLIRN